MVEEHLKFFNLSKVCFQLNIPVPRFSELTCYCSLFQSQTVHNQLLILLAIFQLIFQTFHSKICLWLIVLSKHLFWASYLLLIVMSPRSQWESTVNGGKSLPKTRGLGHMETSRDISDVDAASITSFSLLGISEKHFILLKFSQALLCSTGNYCLVNETSLSSAFSKIPGVKKNRNELWGSPTTGIQPILIADPDACIPAMKLMGQGRKGNK